MSHVVKTECSSCFAKVVVDLAAGTTTTHVPSNGKRGQAYVGAHKVTEPFADDGTLALWDCGACGYADSTYLSATARRTLA
jgi:hypothetical protein